MIFRVSPVYRGLATSGRAENGSKLNFAMEPGVVAVMAVAETAKFNLERK
jgi:hypothetical protein